MCDKWSFSGKQIVSQKPRGTFQKGFIIPSKMLPVVHPCCRSSLVAEVEFRKILKCWPFVYHYSFEIVHCLLLCKFVSCLSTLPPVAAAKCTQPPRVGPSEPLTTPISISHNLNYDIPRVHDKWHHHALLDRYRWRVYPVVVHVHVTIQLYSLLPILYVLVNLFSCINEDIFNIISTEEAIRYSVNDKVLFHLYLAPLSTTGMVIGKTIMKILQNNSHERHWSAKPSAQQCMWLYLCVD